MSQSDSARNYLDQVAINDLNVGGCHSDLGITAMQESEFAIAATRFTDAQQILQRRAKDHPNVAVSRQSYELHLRNWRTVICAEARTLSIQKDPSRLARLIDTVAVAWDTGVARDLENQVAGQEKNAVRLAIARSAFDCTSDPPRFSAVQLEDANKTVVLCITLIGQLLADNPEDVQLQMFHTQLQNRSREITALQTKTST